MNLENLVQSHTKTQTRVIALENEVKELRKLCETVLDSQIEQKAYQSSMNEIWGAISHHNKRLSALENISPVKPKGKLSTLLQNLGL